MLENEVVEVQSEEEKPLKQSIGNALTAFILAFFGAIFSLTGLLSLPGVVL